ncbi:MAG: glycosyltransferase family 2 protein [bacterium]
MTDELVSVIIVTHDSERHLGACLQALKTALAMQPHELVVVDNNSTDNPEPVILEFFPGATVIRSDANSGFAAGCNRGAAQANGEFLLFLNPDVIVDPHAVVALRRVSETGGRLGAVGGRLRFPDGRFQPTCRNFPTATNLIFSRGSALGWLLGGTRVYTLGDYDEPMRVPATAATMMMIRRRIFDRLGGFDERFFMYLEDTDLCYRLSRRNYDNLFVPMAGGIHHWAEGSRARTARRTWMHHRSMWKYFLKHLPNGFTLLILPLLLTVNLLLVLAVNSVGGRRRRV